MIKTSVNTGVMSSGKVGVKRGVFICKNIYNRYSDLDAKQFMYATGISNNQIKDAIYRLCIDLKMAGIFTKCNAIYPFVGGTATTHRFNLIDPRDLNAAFRLQFFGGGTHSANGYQPNGTNGYANTFLSPQGNQSLTSGHFSIYSRTSIASISQFGGSGVRNQTTSLGAQLCLRRLDNARFCVMWDENTGGVVVGTTETNAQGFYLNSRIANNNLVYYKNGSSIGSNTTAQTASSLSSFNYYLAAINESNAIGATYDNKQIAFSSIGAGLTSTEAATYNSIVNNFQVTLNRNV